MAKKSPVISVADIARHGSVFSAMLAAVGKMPADLAPIQFVEKTSSQITPEEYKVADKAFKDKYEKEVVSVDKATKLEEVQEHVLFLSQRAVEDIRAKGEDSKAKEDAIGAVEKEKQEFVSATTPIPTEAVTAPEPALPAEVAPTPPVASPEPTPPSVEIPVAVSKIDTLSEAANKATKDLAKVKANRAPDKGDLEKAELLVEAAQKALADEKQRSKTTEISAEAVSPEIQKNLEFLVDRNNFELARRNVSGNVAAEAELDKLIASRKADDERERAANKAEPAEPAEAVASSNNFAVGTPGQASIAEGVRLANEKAAAPPDKAAEGASKIQDLLGRMDAVIQEEEKGKSNFGTQSSDFERYYRAQMELERLGVSKEEVQARLKQLKDMRGAGRASPEPVPVSAPGPVVERTPTAEEQLAQERQKNTQLEDRIARLEARLAAQEAGAAENPAAAPVERTPTAQENINAQLQQDNAELRARIAQMEAQNRPAAAAGGPPGGGGGEGPPIDAAADEGEPAEPEQPTRIREIGEQQAMSFWEKWRVARKARHEGRAASFAAIFAMKWKGKLDRRDEKIKMWEASAAAAANKKTAMGMAKSIIWDETWASYHRFKGRGIYKKQEAWDDARVRRENNRNEILNLGAATIDRFLDSCNERVDQYALQRDEQDRLLDSFHSRHKALTEMDLAKAKPEQVQQIREQVDEIAACIKHHMEIKGGLEQQWQVERKRAAKQKDRKEELLKYTEHPNRIDTAPKEYKWLAQRQKRPQGSPPARAGKAMTRGLVS